MNRMSDFVRKKYGLFCCTIVFLSLGTITVVNVPAVKNQGDKREYRTDNNFQRQWILCVRRVRRGYLSGLCDKRRL